jgi:hypothetical protein
VDAPRTEAPQLRQLGVGDIVDRVFALYRSRPLLFLGLAAVPYLLLVLVIAVLTFVFAASFIALAGVASVAASGATPDFAALGAALASFLVFGLIVIVFAVVILSAQSAALVDATSTLYLGKPTTFGVAFRNGLRASPRVIGAGLLVFLVVILFWGVLIAAAVVANQALVVVGAVLAALVGTVYIFASTLVMPVVATLEGAGPIAALQRSWRLSAGNRWRIIGIQLLLFVLNVVISGLVSAIFVGSLIGDATLRTILQQVVSIITNVAWAPVQWGAFAILYYDLRVRHEAFDLQLAAEALPREP